MIAEQAKGFTDKVFQDIGNSICLDWWLREFNHSSSFGGRASHSFMANIKGGGVQRHAINNQGDDQSKFNVIRPYLLN